MVVPIADRHLEYAESVRAALADAGLRAEVDARSERMQAKLREAQEQKIPVMAVVGDRDAEAGAVSPRLRTGESSQGVPLAEFVADLVARNASRELWPVRGAEAPAIRTAAYESAYRPPMRKMRGVGQLALLSTDPPRVAEFYESAFGFRRLAGDEGGVDLELGGFELSFRQRRAPRGTGLQIGFKVDTAARWTPGRRSSARRGFALAAPPSGDQWEGSRSFRLADPDGRQVAVFYDYPR